MHVDYAQRQQAPSPAAIRHQDYAFNLRQTDNLIRKTAQKWLEGMLIMVSGDRIDNACCVIFSYQRHPFHFPATATPISLHQANAKFKRELQGTYRQYHELALAKNREIAQIDLPTPAKEQTSGPEGARIQVALAA